MTPVPFALCPAPPAPRGRRAEPGAGPAAPLVVRQRGDAAGLASHPERGAVSQVSLTALLRAAEDGDAVAWNAIVDRFTNLLWSIARGHRLGAADAADVVQTTWLRLVENLGRIQEPERLAGWLATTVRHECLRTLRRSGRELPTESGDSTFDVTDAAAPPEAGLITEERDVQLWQCFEQLQPRCQQLLRVLLADPPPSYAQVSAALDLPVGSIGPTRGRCLDRLRTLAHARGLSLAGLTSTGHEGAPS